MLNRSGPSILPWGTPLATCRRSCCPNCNSTHLLTYLYSNYPLMYLLLKIVSIVLLLLFLSRLALRQESGRSFTNFVHYSIRNLHKGKGNWPWTDSWYWCKSFNCWTGKISYTFDISSSKLLHLMEIISIWVKQLKDSPQCPFPPPAPYSAKDLPFNVFSLFIFII